MARGRASDLSDEQQRRIDEILQSAPELSIDQRNQARHHAGEFHPEHLPSTRLSRVDIWTSDWRVFTLSGNVFIPKDARGTLYFENPPPGKPQALFGVIRDCRPGIRRDDIEGAKFIAWFVCV
ncbi:hypothetical protein BI364_07010 [Acidihalobacter yilgarnensis]|uniref:Uncharacterized protein n=1 Tax=Acidihalobacter yilgarnensis TaxID=2819280 RepID=A0A1D8IMU5_9GAMM|nr:hypothetical protein [Acidihalobacter yilgarnensis]AOU97741.1 hypothetical protein BI364_07010 [Acidihalobacter yilgarnensis]